MTARPAIDLRDPETFPTRRVEDWRWSDLRRYLREAPPPSPPIAVDGAGPFAGTGAAELVYANGHGRAEEQNSGVVQLRFYTDATGTGHQASVSFDIGQGEELLVLESHEGRGAAYVSNARVKIDVGANAKATRIVLMDDVADAISISICETTLAEGARFEQVVLTSGARLQRCETRVSHPGQGASVRLDGLYVLDGQRHADLTTVVEHTDVGGQTDQLTKGVAADRARGVFQGRIVVKHGADQTDARMGHHALILSDRAEIDAKPELEIYADDVACAHGNSIGALDEDALFYAMARGMPEAEARALLTEAFLGEVIDRITHDGAREVAHAWLAQKLAEVA